MTGRIILIGMPAGGKTTIGAALSLDAWIVLRRQDGLSYERATAVWRLTLSALLEHAFPAAANL